MLIYFNKVSEGSPADQTAADKYREVKLNPILIISTTICILK